MNGVDNLTRGTLAMHPHMCTLLPISLFLLCQYTKKECFDCSFDP